MAVFEACTPVFGLLSSLWRAAGNSWGCARKSGQGAVAVRSDPQRNVTHAFPLLESIESSRGRTTQGLDHPQCILLPQFKLAAVLHLRTQYLYCTAACSPPTSPPCRNCIRSMDFPGCATLDQSLRTCMYAYLRHLDADAQGSAVNVRFFDSSARFEREPAVGHERTVGRLC
jgi:hypothetical protein